MDGSQKWKILRLHVADGLPLASLARATGVAAGAERVYLNEDGITISDLKHDVDAMVRAFDRGQNFWLSIRNENASEFYTTDLLTRMFEAEGHGMYSVRGVVLGQAGHACECHTRGAVQAPLAGRVADV